MDALLVMFSRDLKRLNFDNVIPFNKDDLLIVASPNLAFRLTNISDENNNYFSIKAIMEEKDIFDCKDFNKKCREFADIMEARVERYFVTKKARYIFFDEEEQNFIKGIIRRNTLNATIVIYEREDVKNQFKEVKYTDLPYKEYMEVSRYMRRLGVTCVIKPDRYYALYSASKKESEEKFEKLRKNRDGEFMTTMQRRYKKLALIKTKEEFKRYYRGLSKKYHPDSPSGSHEIFAQISADFEKLKETFWYRTLENEEESHNPETHQEQNILTGQGFEE